MQEFSFSTRIFFGEGALERLNKVVNKRVLIVTDPFMAKTGVADRVASYLTDCEVTVFSDVVPDPPIEVVAAGVKCLQECRAEVMVAVGGGSSIDAAKAIRATAGRISTVETEIMECFAIPTTSGTGSEVTEYSVITDKAKGLKYPLVSRALRPPTAILDPSLVTSAPPSVTADSGMDVVLLCPASNAEKIAAGVEKYGIFVLPKPLSVQQAQFALRLIRTSRQRLKKLAEKNRRLTKQLDDVRVITQAKCALALCCGMTEEQAHHLIEKRAMNTRVSSKEAALQLLEDCERKLGHPL